MLVVFWVVSTVESPGTLSKFTVYVAGCICRFVFSENQHVRFDEFSVKVGSLPHEAVNDIDMALGEHCWNDIPFGRKIEECELVAFFGDEAFVSEFSTIDV